MSDNYVITSDFVTDGPLEKHGLVIGLRKRIAELENGIREHRDSFSKDMEEHDWTTEDETLWALVEKNDV